VVVCGIGEVQASTVMVGRGGRLLLASVDAAVVAMAAWVGLVVVVAEVVLCGELVVVVVVVVVVVAVVVGLWE